MERLKCLVITWSGNGIEQQHCYLQRLAPVPTACSISLIRIYLIDDRVARPRYSFYLPWNSFSTSLENVCAKNVIYKSIECDTVLNPIPRIQANR